VSVVDNVPQPLRVMVTGGIGSGKSTVLQVLEELGAVIIEADRIGRELLEPGGAAHARVAARWPQAVVDGRIERGRLAAIVFSDPEQLAELEAISHPLIAAEIRARVAAAGDRDVVVEVPLASDLAGPGWIKIVVDAPREARLRRAVRRGMGSADVAGRMNAQPDRATWLAGADVVIDNRGSIEELESRVRGLWAELSGVRDR
jgi:dephospho-CoA kinase